jgi:GDP-D-mannose dehydratase
MDQRSVLIRAGQDRAFLAELLLGQGHYVHGIKCLASSNTGHIDVLLNDRHEDHRSDIWKRGPIQATNATLSTDRLPAEA